MLILGIRVLRAISKWQDIKEGVLLTRPQESVLDRKMVLSDMLHMLQYLSRKKEISGAHSVLPLYFIATKFFLEDKTELMTNNIFSILLLC